MPPRQNLGNCMSLFHDFVSFLLVTSVKTCVNVLHACNLAALGIRFNTGPDIMKFGFQASGPGVFRVRFRFSTNKSGSWINSA